MPDAAEEISHLIIGRITGARGLRGELKVQILTDFPKRFTSLKRVFAGDPLAEYEVEAVRFHQNMALIMLKGIDAPEKAERLRGQLLKIPVEEAVPLAKGQFYWHQIIGVEVRTTSGDLVGKVVDILETGANDVYVVRTDSRDVLVPAIADVVKDISPEKHTIVIEPIPGLLD